jgi:hypothetical protein
LIGDISLQEGVLGQFLGQQADETITQSAPSREDRCQVVRPIALKPEAVAMNPYCWLVIASSLFMVRAANPMLTRST